VSALGRKQTLFILFYLFINFSFWPK